MLGESTEQFDFSKIADQEKFGQLSDEEKQGLIDQGHKEALKTNVDFGEPGVSKEKSEVDRETEYLKTSKKVGEYYTNLVNRFTGKEGDSDQNLGDLDHPIKSKLSKINQRAKDGFEQQHILAQMKGLDARKILQQVSSFSTPEMSAKFADGSKFRSEELSPGVFAIYIEENLYAGLIGQNSGLAIKYPPGEGISFILLPEYPIGHPNRNSQLSENIPHETHHLVWNFSKGEAISTNEKDKDMADAFIMYQDEVMARLSSDGDLAGYTHLQMLDPETRQQFEQGHPDTARKITEIMVSLNDLLQEIDGIRKQTDISKQDLILVVMDASNFDQLNQNLINMKSIIEKQPKTKAVVESSGGWDSI